MVASLAPQRTVDSTVVSTVDSTVAGTLLRPPIGPGRTALMANDERVTYEELNERVSERIEHIGLHDRTIVALAGENSIEFVVTYLALLEAGHVPLLAGEHADALASAWPAGAVVHAPARGCTIRHTGARAPELHPDLALLVSTSGSTGSPKLVRLSHRNLVSNALAIGSYLGLTTADRGVTSLPLHYCYGLSVLHSHLAVGAGVVVTNTSVVDRCFRSILHEHDVTNLAGVPHTFDLLDRSDPEGVRTPSMRLLTQAGGRMAPANVTRWTARARSWGADFVVMYGQTEATARIAYLPPDLADRCPGSIGRAIPGGAIELESVDGQPDDVGELVYRGPNVMMGYAADVEDLALGQTLDELRTGDLARYRPEDRVYEIVGRRSRFVKPFGLRIDLDVVEERMRTVPSVGDVAVAGDDHRVTVFAPGADPSSIAEELIDTTGLPPGCLRIVDRPIPRTASGKVDGAAMLAVATDGTTKADEPSGLAGAGEGVDVESVFSTVLGRRDIDADDTFVSLGGDSLSYVECSIRLEEMLGHLPRDWHLLPVSALEGAPPRPRRFARLGRLDTTVLLRALGICLVVSTHMRVRHLPGGAHVLLAVAGFNLSRFMAPLAGTAERMRAGLRTAARAAIPTMVWVAAGMALFGSYSLGTLLLVNNYVGPSSHADDHWHFWFIEVFVHLVLIATLLVTIPVARRGERRFLYVAPLAALAVTLVLRMDWAHMDDWYNLRFRTHGVAWFFVLGWLIQRSSTHRQKLVTTVVCLAVIPGFFHVAAREWRIVALLLVLVWVRELPVPRLGIRPIGVLAAASLWIYVSHFSLWPVIDDVFVREVAYVLTIAAGVGVWFVAERLLGSLNTWRQGRPRLRTTTQISPQTTQGFT